MRPLRTDAAVRDPHRPRPRALDVLRHSRGAHPGHGGPRALPRAPASASARRSRTASTTTSRCRGPSRPRTSRRSRPRWRRSSSADYPFVREEVDRAEANRRFADDPLKLERIGELGDDEVISIVHRRPVHRPLPRPARARHRPAQALQAARTARAPTGAATSSRQMLQRIYGTAFFKKDELDAHLHRLEEAQEARPPRLGKELDLFMFHPFAPGAAFWTDRGHDAATTRSTTSCASCSATATRRSRRRCSTTRGCGRSRGTGASTGRTCSSCSTTRPGEHDFSLKPMNCPSHHLYLRREEALVPRAAAALRHLRRAAPERGVGRAVGAHARAAVPAGRLPHLPDARPDRRRGAAPHGLHPRRTTRRSGSRRRSSSPRAPSSGSATTRCGTAPRRRCARRSRRRACRTSSSRATARSTAPRSTSTSPTRSGATWQLGTIQLDYDAPERFDLELRRRGQRRRTARW